MPTVKQYELNIFINMVKTHKYKYIEYIILK